MKIRTSRSNPHDAADTRIHVRAGLAVHVSQLRGHGYQLDDIDVHRAAVREILPDAALTLASVTGNGYKWQVG